MLAEKLSGAVGNAANPTYIEDVFSTYLYTGNGSTQSIVNGIDLSTQGGMTWLKARDVSASNYLFDTARGRAYSIRSDSTAGQATSGSTNDLTSFNTNGFSLGVSSQTYTNVNASTFVSWTFRKQPKFFDVVTWTGDGTGARTISHSLGSAPGCMFVKRTDTTQDWSVYHQALTTPATDELYLNRAYAANTGVSTWNSSAPTSTSFSVDSTRNANGGTFVAYIFAHNAGGFGLNGTDNVITCGTFTSGSSDTFVSLGYEPQFVLWKNKGTEDWRMFDNMRGVPTGGNTAQLKPNASSAEDSSFQFIDFNSTGFTYKIAGGNPSQTYIYIAIRRGPMKVPTDGTKVYNAVARTGTAATAQITTVGFPPDAVWGRRKDANYGRNFDRLRGTNNSLAPAVTSGEAAPSDSLNSYDMSGFSVGADPSEHINASGIPYIYWNFKRAPSFFDEVCYTGTSTPTAYTHNLGAVPELMIVKRRSGSEAGGTAGYWIVYAAASGNANALFLNTNDGNNGASVWNSTTPTATTFTVNDNYVNYSGDKYVAYLFATCAGVSKVGSYTGTGTTKQVDCGFTAGARFVLIKRTDSTGNWYIWDTVRGIVSGNDPYLVINNISGSPSAEVTSTDYIDPYSAGFEISSTAPAAINASGGTFIFLAIA